MSRYTSRANNSHGELDDLPGHLTEHEVRAAAEDAETLLDAQNLLRMGRTRTRRIFKRRGLLDEVRKADAATFHELRERQGGEG